MNGEEFRKALKVEFDLFAMEHGPVLQLLTNERAQELLDEALKRSSVPGATTNHFDDARVMCCLPGAGIRVELHGRDYFKMKLWLAYPTSSNT